jgi:DNA-binding LytR/AlgR family response regulator
MPIKIGICDDSAEDIRLLAAELIEYDPSVEITSYTNGQFLVDDLVESQVVFDLLFLDIYMPGMTGIEIAQRIHDSSKHSKIIFISSSIDHYSEAFSVFAFNYITKPIDRGTLVRILDQAMKGILIERRQTISFTYKSESYRVFCRDVMCLESVNKLLVFHMANGEVLQCYGKLNELLTKFPAVAFIRCHQSYAVNLFYINKMGEHYFQIGETLINISKRCLKESKEKYLGFLFSRMDLSVNYGQRS